MAGYGEVESGTFIDVPDLLESKLSDTAISRGLGHFIHPNDEHAAAQFSVTAVQILEKLSALIPANPMGTYSTESSEWKYSTSRTKKKLQEEQICDYFNAIADRVCEEYGVASDASGLRKFASMDKPPAGIPMNSKRKPDGVVLDSELSNTEENEADWSDMHAIMRLRVTADSASFNSAFRQILDNARMIFCSQRIRRFVLGVIFISDNTMAFCVFDRSGVLCTERFDIMNDPEKLIRVVVGLLFADLIDLGYDPTVTVRVNEGGDGASKKEVVVALKNVEYTIERTLQCGAINSRTGDDLLPYRT
ncbi:hypothetical protein EW145_g7678 [Phellinidium pouzarii]|uniref:Fungal-type protein kinase domain-containing protein n=1 Tax=Phellinidium pouzarii TaxID=167371 RepID=A0A4S4KFQ9_9AGAM|nr:hypothetical protein EW145_g7678 [Phellinidium pouzarii]